MTQQLKKSSLEGIKKKFKNHILNHCKIKGVIFFLQL